MTTTTSSQPIQPLSDLPPQNQPFKLHCRACKHVAEYPVGRLVVDPDFSQGVDFSSAKAYLQSLTKVDWGKWVSFAGYFVCKRCGSGGPWDLSADAKGEIVQLMLRHFLLPQDSGIFVGEAMLFDGTSHRTGYDSVAHMRKLIDADPTNAYLWNRLGNTFVGAQEPAMAKPAFEKAIELDPLDMESLHSLGDICFDSQADDEAVRYLHRLLAHCRSGNWYREEIREPLVLAAIETLLDISATIGSETPLLPKLPALERAETALAPELRTFDLSKEADRRRLAQLFLGAPMPKLQKTLHNDWQQKPVATSFPSNRAEPTRLKSARVGRNDPCPCGSGKKYKKCCYR